MLSHCTHAYMLTLLCTYMGNHMGIVLKLPNSSGRSRPSSLYKILKFPYLLMGLDTDLIWLISAKSQHRIERKTTNLSTMFTNPEMNIPGELFIVRIWFVCLQINKNIDNSAIGDLQQMMMAAGKFFSVYQAIARTGFRPCLNLPYHCRCCYQSD